VDMWLKSRQPDREEMIRTFLSDSSACPDLLWLKTVDSTNTFLKKAAAQGAAHKTVVIADCQSAGRGRMGRVFQSTAGQGIYLSLLLRPDVPPEELLAVTGMAAVAVCRAIRRCCHAPVRIKWVNDILLHGRKLCGILAESVIVGDRICLVIGVGINVSQTREDFTPAVARLATSLAMEGYTLSREALSAALVEELFRLADEMVDIKTNWIDEYRAACVNPGREARLVWSETEETVQVLDVDGRFGLVVRRENGAVDVIRTGEVSLRCGETYDEER